MAPENHAGFATVAVYQKPNKYSDGFPYSSMAEMMSCSLSVCIYCVQMYIEKRLLGEKLPFHVSVASMHPTSQIVSQLFLTLLHFFFVAF